MSQTLHIIGAEPGMGRIMTSALMLGGFNNVVNIRLEHDTLPTKAAKVSRYERHQGAREIAKRLLRDPKHSKSAKVAAGLDLSQRG